MSCSTPVLAMTNRTGGASAVSSWRNAATAVGRFVGDRVSPTELAADVLGPTLTDHTRTAIVRAASAAQGLTLLLASPEFQRR